MNNQDLLVESIEKCYMPRLARAIDETEDHAEYYKREDSLDTHFPSLIEILRQLDFRIETDIASTVLPKLIILDMELRSDGPWFREKCKEYSRQLNQTFDMMNGSKLSNILECKNVFNPQLLFDKCMEDLHMKMTSTTFKNYPCLTAVYCTILNNVKDYDIKLNPMSVLPVALFLIDDYNVGNKIKGLKCCLAVLECLTSAVFNQGNYYEVVYGSLKKCLLEKDLEVTKLTSSCLLLLLPMLASDIKVTKTDDVYKTVLDQLYTESNLYRKATCFNFAKQIIEIHGVHCVKRKLFKTIMCDALDVCSNEAVAEILLQDVLECLSVWLKNCWCVWKLSSDQKMLSTLFKVLFVMSENEEVVPMVLNLVMTMVQLCTKKEQAQIYYNLELFIESFNNNINENFVNKVDVIKKSICV